MLHVVFLRKLSLIVRCFAVAEKQALRVEDIINFRTGTLHKASEFLTLEEGKVISLRRELSQCYQKNEKFLTCAYCQKPLFLKGGGEAKNKQRLHFSHFSNDGEECPFGQRGKSKEEMRALIYHGVKESPIHIEMKNSVAVSLSSDPRFHDTYIDEVYKYRLPEERYRPDVQTWYLDKNIVFEIQVSPEFITIIQSREDYYTRKKAYLL